MTTRKKAGFLGRVRKAYGDREVPLPEMKTTVTVKALTEAESQAIEGKFIIPASKPGGRADVDERMAKNTLIVACCYDAAGNRLFDEDDIETLDTELPGKVYKLLAAEALRANGYLEDAEGNS